LGTQTASVEVRGMDLNQARAEQQALVERILASQAFQGSRKLRQLLMYIAECTLRETPDECTEQQIGIHVFGRQPGYNTAEDSIVRSQVRLLRQRLDSYFENEERDGPLRLEIPKGHYIASILEHPRREECAPSDHEAEHRGTVPERASSAASVGVPLRFEGWRVRVFLPGILLLLAMAFWAGTRFEGTAPPQPRMPILWQGFLHSGREPMVIFSNANFVGNGTQGLHYTTDDEQSSQPIMDHYTGIGEVAAIYNLTKFFDRYHVTFTLKRSRLVTWDDARSRDLIFIGASLENPSLLVLPDSKDFNFVRDGDAFDIVNRRPQEGEPLRMNHDGWPMKVDYAIVSLRPGLEAGTKMLVFSGMTTIGTQAAVEFACSPAGADQLLPPAIAEAKPNFEAVLKVTVNSGVPVASSIVAIHRS